MAFAAHYSGPNGPATGGFIGATYPHWMSVDHEGNVCKKNGFDWISGINPDVQEFMLKLIMEVVRKYDIDGIEFSDRMPALPRECGYDEGTVALYRSEHDGADPSPFPRKRYLDTLAGRKAQRLLPRGARLGQKRTMKNSSWRPVRIFIPGAITSTCRTR